MTTEAHQYYARLAAAFVRGTLQAPPADTPADLFALPLESLSAAQAQTLIDVGLAAGLRLHRFKRTMGLPRVRAVLGALRGLQPASLLDIGSGRGAFLWPLLEAFPDLPVTTIDRLPHRVRDMQAVRHGGVTRLTALAGDATALPFADQTSDVVTLLEVLEHIPDAERALAECLRVAARHIVVSVPSKADDNPEHIHLFAERDIRRLFVAQGVSRLSVTYVLNHLLVVSGSLHT